jgi:hypothetical protein
MKGMNLCAGFAGHKSPKVSSVLVDRCVLGLKHLLVVHDNVWYCLQETSISRLVMILYRRGLLESCLHYALIAALTAGSLKEVANPRLVGPAPAL